MLKKLVTILVRPRATMREVLDHVHATGKDRMVLPLVLLTLFTGFVSDFDAVQFSKVADQHGMDMLWLVILGAVIAVLLVMVGLFYAVAWLGYLIGRAIEGTGNARDVRSAMAWGLTPMVWSLLYAIPAAILYARPKEGGIQVTKESVRFVPTALSEGCGWWFVLGLLDLAIVIWTIVVMSHTIGEAHRFSSLRGFATICLLLITPIIITIAAALTLKF